MIVHVDDPADVRLDPFRWRDRQLASRTDRLESVGAGMFIAEGDLVVQRALDTSHEPLALLCDAVMGEQFSVRLPESTTVFIAPESVRREVTGLGVPLSAVGLFRRPPLLDPDELVRTARHIVVLEAVDNPTNIGAIVRSAVALGWDGLILGSGSADPLARRALRVSMGTSLAIPFARLSPGESVSSLMRRHSCETFALTPRGDAEDISSVSVQHDGRIAILLGSERDGLDESTMTRADHLVRIPMHSGVDSLNVGAAAAIAMHALRAR